MDEKERRIEEIKKEVELLNIQMKSMRYDRYSKAEKLGYIDKQISLWDEMKELVGFMDKLKINGALLVLEGLRKTLLMGKKA